MLDDTDNARELYKDLPDILKFRVSAMVHSKEFDQRQINQEVNNCHLAVLTAKRFGSFKRPITIDQEYFETLKTRHGMEHGGIDRRFLINMSNCLKDWNKNPESNLLTERVLAYEASCDQHGEPHKYNMKKYINDYTLDCRKKRELKKSSTQTSIDFGGEDSAKLIGHMNKAGNGRKIETGPKVTTAWSR